MTPELYWLAATCVLTALLWVPYVLNIIAVRGLMDAMGYPDNPKPMAAWAQRLKHAHYNAVENLVVFAPLVIIAHLADIHSSMTVMACMLYFWTRLAYAVIYTAGIPVVRTLAFDASWVCIMILAGAILL